MTTTQNDEIDLITFLRVLLKFKYVVVVTTILFGFTSIIIALTATPIFHAEVLVVRVSDSTLSGATSLASKMGGLGGLLGVSLGGDGNGLQARAILDSRHMAEEFIKRNDLVADLSPKNGDSPSLWRSVKMFRELVLTIREDSGDGITTISIDWIDPEIAARWANDYTALANEIIRTRARAELEQNVAYLKQQIDETNVVPLERVMYNLLEVETKNLMLANARVEYAFTVVDPAVAPEIRSKPRRKIIVLSGVVLGIFFGMFLVFVIHVYRQVRMSE